MPSSCVVLHVSLLPAVSPMEILTADSYPFYPLLVIEVTETWAWLSSPQGTLTQQLWRKTTPTPKSSHRNYTLPVAHPCSWPLPDSTKFEGKMTEGWTHLPSQRDLCNWLIVSSKRWMKGMHSVTVREMTNSANSFFSFYSMINMILKVFRQEMELRNW